MKFKDKVSIIIPTYNRAKLIKKSINSILNQTYDNIEVIVVDDCSTDNTEEVIKKIKDERVKYIKLKKNSGACVARNTGIKAATGKYITFNDSDDEYLPKKIETQYNNLIRNKSDMDFCQICIHDGDYSSIIPTSKQEESFKLNRYTDELVKGNYISTLVIFVKSKIINKYLFDAKLPRFQDYDLALRIIPDIKVSYTNKALVNAYRQSDSISSSPTKLFAAIKIMLNKKYEITEEQKRILNMSLIDIYSNDVTNHYESICYNMNNVINDQKEQIDRLTKDYNYINNLYNSIINSKRWKMIDAALKKIKK